MIGSIHWKTISRFESHDFVRTWYRKAHEREASASKVAQINASFVHGREYFRNAANSDMSVRPLLLYYGVLSCCRGVILANDAQKKEESLKPRHGLKTVDWQETLSGGIRNVLDLSIQSTDGTFCELVAVCSHVRTVHRFQGPTYELGSSGQALGHVRFATDGSQMTLDDLLARLLQTGLAYPDLTGRRAKMFGGVRIASHPPGVHLAFPFYEIPKELKKLADGKNIYLGSSNMVAPGIRRSDDARDCLIFHNTYLDALPVSHYGGKGETMAIMLDFPNGDKLTEFVKLYLVSYILGRLVRYHPSIWTSLLRNERGDFAQPLLLDAIEVIEGQFAQQLSYQLRGFIRKKVLK